MNKLFAVILVAVLLILAMQMALIEMTKVRPSPAESVVDGTTVIQGDVTWEGRDGIVELPVDVQSGARLDIVDCDLRVRLEDLVIDGHSWFQVDQGGTLALEGSTITIVPPESIDDICFLDHVSTGRDYLQNGPQMLWRAVDLQGSSSPHLVLDVDPRGRSGELVVAVRTAPGRPFTAVRTVDVRDDRTRAWHRVDVQLTAYAGSIVMLSVAATDDGLTGAMLRDVRVLDGDGDLPGDSFPTGRPTEDGWRCNYVRNLHDAMSYEQWPDLVRVSGRLEVRDSTMAGPTVPRGGRQVHSGAIKTFVLGPSRGTNVDRLLGGGDVRVVNGDLVVEGSVLDNVTVRALSSTVEVRASELVADREPLTLYSCDGHVEGTTLRSAYGEWSGYNPWFTPDEPFLWAMSLWRSRGEGAFRIEGCTFQDTVLGVDLAHASATVTGCRFVNVTSISVWDHDSTGIGDWANVNASNEFVGCGGQLLLRTHDCEVSFAGPGKPTNWQDPDIDCWGRASAVDGGATPRVDWLWVYRASADLYMPTLVVDRRWKETRPAWVDLDLWTSWGGRILERVPTGEREHVATFTGQNMTPKPAYGGYDGIWWPRLNDITMEPASAGMLRMLVSVYTFETSSNILPAPLRDLSVSLRNATTTIREVDVKAEGRLREHSMYEVEMVLPAPHGLSLLSVDLTCVPEGETALRTLETRNITVFGVDAPASWLDITEELAGTSGETFIMLGPGIELVVTDLDLAREEAWGAELILPEGSMFTMRCVASKDLLETYIEAHGSGDIVLEDIDLPSLALVAPVSNITISNASVGTMTLWTKAANVTLHNVSTMIDFWVTDGANVSMDGCRIRVREDNPWWTSTTNLTIEGSAIIGEGRGFGISAGAADLTVTDTLIEGVRLSIDLEHATGNVTITGCVFSEAFLALEDVDESLRPMDGLEIRGNRFVGSDAGIEAPEWLLLRWMGENAVAVGARLEYENTTTFELIYPGNQWELGSLYFEAKHLDPSILEAYGFTSRVGTSACLLFKRSVGDLSEVRDHPTVHVAVVQDGLVIWFLDIDTGAEGASHEVPLWVGQLDGMRTLIEGLWKL